MTGDRLPDLPATIEARQRELDEVYAEVFGSETSKPPPAHEPLALDDAELLERARAARNGATFERLYGGDAYGYSSQSEADQALANLLAFWAGPDPERIDWLFRGSGLMREKWERSDYRSRTIARALEGRTEFYSPRRARRISRPGARRNRGAPAQVGRSQAARAADGRGTGTARSPGRGPRAGNRRRAVRRHRWREVVHRAGARRRRG